MGKDDWVGLLAIIGGLAILGAALSKKKVDYFRCWNCNRVILKGSNPCPYCQATISWDGGSNA